MTSVPLGRIRVGSIVLPRPRGHAALILIPIGLLIVLLATLALTSVLVSLAVFTSNGGDNAVFGTKAIFPGSRATTAFAVTDASSGGALDRSSGFAAASDGITTTSSAWSTAFDSSRYLEFDLNNSLASGVLVSPATFSFRFASSGSGQACFYFDVRQISTGAPVATYGSSGSPIGCVTGTTPSTFTTSIAAVSSTAIANDLRIRVFGRESSGGSMVIDLASVSGSTAYQSFVLFPIVFRDAATGIPAVIPWGMDIP